MNFKDAIMKKLISILWAILLFVSGCQENPVIPEEEQLVLQAYLYADEPVTEITIMLSRPLSSSDTVNTLISTANVLLYKNNTGYQLTPSLHDPGKYYYAGNDLSIYSNDEYSIAVNYNGMIATASTIVPLKPVTMTLNNTVMTFTRDTSTMPFGGMPPGDMRVMIRTSDSLVVTWDNPHGEAYYVVVESVDLNRQALRSDTMSRFMDRRFVTEPIMEDHYRIFDQDIKYTGKHKVTLYRVNQEYVDLYKSRQQDSRSLNEPLTNVKNGLGIFTAFASDSLFIHVVLQ
jgi:hypothetical protein